MAHKPVEGVSPRFSVALELSDTLLCLGKQAVRSRTPHGYNIAFAQGHLTVSTPYSISLVRDGFKPLRFRGPQEAKRQLMELYA